MTESFSRVEEERSHDEEESEWVGKRRDPQLVSVNKAENTQCPDHPEDGGKLHDVLLREVVPRVKLKYQNVVHPRRPPSIHVDPHEEEELHYQKGTPEQSQRCIPVADRAIVTG